MKTTEKKRRNTKKNKLAIAIPQPMFADNRTLALRMAELTIRALRAISFQEELTDASPIGSNQQRIIFVSLHQTRLKRKTVAFVGKIDCVVDVGVDYFHDIFENCKSIELIPENTQWRLSEFVHSARAEFTQSVRSQGFSCT
jgi:hypothetical protein